MLEEDNFYPPLNVSRRLKPTCGQRALDLWAMIRLAKVLRHAALAPNTFFEGDACQVALAVVGPGMVDALEVFNLA
jgi:hypothetical protein